MARLSFELPVLGFGAFKIGRNAGIKYERPYELPDIGDVERLLNGVLDLGISYIDTAPAYGLSEERIGATLAHCRSEFVLSTKVGEFFENGVSRHDFSRSAIEESVKESLRRLRTDVIDVLFLHADQADLRILRETDAVETLTALRGAGCARAIGFSGYTAGAFREALAWADAIMVEYHSEDASLAPVIAEAAARGIAVVVKKGLGSGRIAPRSAIPFVLRNRGVTSLVVGSLTLDHLREDLGVARGVRPACGAGEPGFRPPRADR